MNQPHSDTAAERGGLDRAPGPMLTRLALGAALAVLLSGCAVAVIPAVAGGIVAREGIEHRQKAKKSLDETARRTTEQREKTRGGPVAVSQSASAFPAGPTSKGDSAAIIVPGPLPPPAGQDPFVTFADYAIAQAAKAGPGMSRRSMLVEPDSLTGPIRLPECHDKPPAVVIDLDPRAEPFDLQNPPLPAAGLGRQLARLRSAGISVFWIASLPADSTEDLHTTLRATELDPEGTDQILLLRNADERKQVRRQAIAADWCVVAIAADTRGDFEEAFDYLRDPDGPIAATLESYIGAGWFLVPPPIE
jgi:hypothetical protein